MLTPKHPASECAWLSAKLRRIWKWCKGHFYSQVCCTFNKLPDKLAGLWFCQRGQSVNCSFAPKRCSQNESLHQLERGSASRTERMQVFSTRLLLMQWTSLQQLEQLCCKNTGVTKMNVLTACLILHPTNLATRWYFRGIVLYSYTFYWKNYTRAGES